MNKLRGYKFKKYIYDTFARHRVPGWGCHILVGIGASRIRFGSANWVGSKKGCYKLVVLDPRFRRFWKSLGLGGSGIEYMIEKHVSSNVLA